MRRLVAGFKRRLTVMAAIRADLRLTTLQEFSPDTEFAVHYPRAEKYVGWPMLVVLLMDA